MSVVAPGSIWQSVTGRPRKIIVHSVGSTSASVYPYPRRPGDRARTVGLTADRSLLVGYRATGAAGTP